MAYIAMRNEDFKKEFSTHMSFSVIQRGTMGTQGHSLLSSYADRQRLTDTS